MKGFYYFRSPQKTFQNSHAEKFINQAKEIGYHKDQDYLVHYLRDEVVVEIHPEVVGILSTLVSEHGLQFDIDKTIARLPKRMVNKKGSVRIILV